MLDPRRVAAHSGLEGARLGFGLAIFGMLVDYIYGKGRGSGSSDRNPTDEKKC